MDFIKEFLNLPYTKFFLDYWYIIMPLAILQVPVIDYFHRKGLGSKQ